MFPTQIIGIAHLCFFVNKRLKEDKILIIIVKGKSKIEKKEI